jgi:hypothetical protein
MRGVIHDVCTKISRQWEELNDFISNLTLTEVSQFKEKMVKEDNELVGYNALQLWYSRLESDVIKHLRNGLDHIGRADLAGKVNFCLLWIAPKSKMCLESFFLYRHVGTEYLHRLSLTNEPNIAIANADWMKMRS